MNNKHRHRDIINDEHKHRNIDFMMLDVARGIRTCHICGRAIQKGERCISFLIHITRKNACRECFIKCTRWLSKDLVDEGIKIFSDDKLLELIFKNNNVCPTCGSTIVRPDADGVIRI